MTRDRQTTSVHEATAQTPPEVLHSRIRWVANARWIVFCGAIVSAGCIWWLTDRSPSNLFATYGLLLSAVILGIINLVGMAMLGGRRLLDSAWLSKVLQHQMHLDILPIAILIMVSGGARSPLIGLAVLHVALASSLIEVKAAYALASSLAVIYAFFTLLSADLGRFNTGGTIPVPVAIILVVSVTAVLLGTVYFTHALIARLRRINHRLVEANRRLEGLDLAKSRFLRVSAHQLRSPLAAVHTMLSAVQEAGGLNHQQYEIVRKIQARSEDAMRLVDEMMLLSTIRESAAEVRQLEPVDVDAAVREEVEAFSAEVLAKKLTVCIGAASGVRVMAWEDALQTVMEHLVSNAVKYTPAGGSISIETLRTSGGVEMKVADTGIGIPPEEKDRLFHEFFRATNARQIAGGTGMGLAIVHAIVERLGGTIIINSAQDKGTSVTVTLPAAKELPADAAKPAGEQVSRTSAPDETGRLEMSAESLHLKTAK